MGAVDRYGLGEFSFQGASGYFFECQSRVIKGLANLAASIPFGKTEDREAVRDRIQKRGRWIQALAQRTLGAVVNVQTPVCTSGLNFDNSDLPDRGFEASSDLLVSADAWETTQWRWEMIDCAEQSLVLSGNYCGGKVFQETLDRIEDRLELRPALKVWILYSPEGMEKQDRARIRHLSRVYPDRFHAQKTPALLELLPHPRLIENHVKMTVVDEKYFIVGGTGLLDHLCKKGDVPPSKKENPTLVQQVVASSSRDMDVVGRGGMAPILTREFYKLYAVHEHRLHVRPGQHHVEHYEQLDPAWGQAVMTEFDEHPDRVADVHVKLTCCGPESSSNACMDEIVEQVELAKSSIRLAQMNMNPGGAVKKALRGLDPEVALEILTNGVGGSSPPTNHFFVWPSLGQYHPLLARGESGELSGSVYEYDVKDVLYHKKVMTVDDRVTLIGSYNFAYKSEKCDHEILLTIHSPELTAKVQEVLDRDKELSRQVTDEQVKLYRKHPKYRVLSALHRRTLGRFVA